jgi:N-acetylmuramoyl-L-alanine amidase
VSSTGAITERAAIGNRAHANAAISIHADGVPSDGRGFHGIYPPSIAGLTDDIAASSHLLALDVRAAFARGTGMPYATCVGHDGLDVRGDLGGLNLSDVPKVFIETGNYAVRRTRVCSWIRSSASGKRAPSSADSRLF